MVRTINPIQRSQRSKEVAKKGNEDMVKNHHPFELETAASMKILSGKTQRHPPKRRELGPLTKLKTVVRVIISKEGLKLKRFIYYTLSTP